MFRYLMNPVIARPLLLWMGALVALAAIITLGGGSAELQEALSNLF